MRWFRLILDANYGQGMLEAVSSFGVRVDQRSHCGVTRAIASPVKTIAFNNFIMVDLRKTTATNKIQRSHTPRHECTHN